MVAVPASPTVTLAEAIGYELRRAREALRLTQMEAASRYGCSRVRWTQLEGVGTKDLDVLAAAADAVDVHIELAGVRVEGAAALLHLAQQRVSESNS